MSEVRYPGIKVPLSKESRGAWRMAAICQALQDGGVPHTEIAEFLVEVKAAGWGNVLQVAKQWVEVE